MRLRESVATEPRDRSAPAQRRASERVGESEGRSPSENEERRREARVAGRGVRARVRPGHHLVVLDVSAGGALVEAACQLRPGSRIEVHLETEDRRDLIAARVTRCAVAAIDPQTGITYRAALCFAESCEWVRERTTPEGYAVHEASRKRPPPAGELEARLPVATGADARDETRGSK